MKLSNLANQMCYTAIPEITAYAKQFSNILFYTHGEPDIPSPELVKQEVIKALSQDDTHYPEIQGNSQLRHCISRQYSKRHNINLTQENVLISNGATGGLYLCLLTLLSAGDEIILLTPHYANYIGQIQSVGAVPKLVHLNQDNQFELNIADIEQAITDKTKALLLNFPNNPLGTVLDECTMLQLGQLAKKYDLFIISDEVYRNLVFDAPHCSFLHNQQTNLAHTFVIDSMSKSYSMAGYRLGYVMSTNQAAIKIMTEFNDWIYGGVPNFIQRAAIKALEQKEAYSQYIAQMYRQNREQLFNGLARIKGLKYSIPPATFYAFVDIRQTQLSSKEFVYRLIDEQQIVVVPGSNYGQAGEGFIRISYAVPSQQISELLIRLERFMEKALSALK